MRKNPKSAVILEEITTWPDTSPEASSVSKKLYLGSGRMTQETVILWMFLTNWLMMQAVLLQRNSDTRSNRQQKYILPRKRNNDASCRPKLPLSGKIMIHCSLGLGYKKKSVWIDFPLNGPISIHKILKLILSYVFFLPCVIQPAV